MGNHVHCCQHHTKTVEQRYADTKFVICGKAHVLTGKETVVGNIVVGKHNSFRESCCSRRILHVHHIVAAHALLDGSILLILKAVLSQKQQLRNVVHSPVFLLTNEYNILQHRKLVALEVTPSAGSELWDHLIYHAHEIAVALAVNDTKGMHIRVLAYILQLRKFVVGVYCNCNCAQFCTGIQYSKPVWNVGCPDTHMRAFGNTNLHKSFGNVVNPLVQLGIGKAEIPV